MSTLKDMRRREREMRRRAGARFPWTICAFQYLAEFAAENLAGSVTDDFTLALVRVHLKIAEDGRSIVANGPHGEAMLKTYHLHVAAAVTASLVPQRTPLVLVEDWVGLARRRVGALYGHPKPSTNIISA